MRTIKGPGLFLAQFARDTPPHNTLEGIARWAKDYGYKAIQIPTWDARFFNLDLAHESAAYCDEVKGKLADIGIAVSELSTHFQGQMVSVHPAYDAMFDGQCPPHLRGNPEKRRHWAADQVRKGALVSRRFGLTEHVSFTGSLAWPYFYPYPQRPAGLIEECFAEQARRWKPILDVYDENGVDLCFEIHPTEDVFDGDTFDMFLDAVGGHKRRNINYDASHYIKQCMDYLDFIDAYHERIKMFHVKDAEFIRRPDRASTAATRVGWNVPDATARSGTDRSISRRSSQSSRLTTSQAGRSTSGSAFYSIRKSRRAKARNSSPTTSSR
jgi:sugar phosphate isomerase/epimerase